MHTTSQVWNFACFLCLLPSLSFLPQLSLPSCWPRVSQPLSAFKEPLKNFKDPSEQERSISPKRGSYRITAGEMQTLKPSWDFTNVLSPNNTSSVPVTYSPTCNTRRVQRQGEGYDLTWLECNRHKLCTWNTTQDEASNLNSHPGAYREVTGFVKLVDRQPLSSGSVSSQFNEHLEF